MLVEEGSGVKVVLGAFKGECTLQTSTPFFTIHLWNRGH